MFAVLGGVTLLSHIYNLNNIKSKTVGDGQHGTARWATQGEIKHTYQHIPFTPQKWRKQAKEGHKPTFTKLNPKALFRKSKSATEQPLPQGIVVGCQGNNATTALVDTGDVHVLMIGAAGVGAEAVKIFGEASFGIVSAILTLLILVVSEIIPKTIGASYWRKLALMTASVIRVLIIITYPLVWVSELITKLFASKEGQLSVSREEVSAMVAVASEEGVLKADESKIIQNTIKLAGVPAEEVMTPNPVVLSVPECMTVKEFFAQGELSYSRIPVWRDNRDCVVGYVLKSTILELLAKDSFNTEMREIMRPVLSFEEDTSLFKVWEKMLEMKEHISILIDRYGCFRGIVTMEDVIETMLGREIMDEADTTPDLQMVALEKYKARLKD